MGVIEKSEGACVVLAGAGTGKTHTIVEKIKYLVSASVYKPEKIVCITFSNEAANSLLARVQKSLEKDGEKVIIRTFHGFSADLLREFGDKIGLNKNFNILDPDEAKVVLHTNLKIPVGNCSRYISSIGQAKDLGIRIEDVENYLIKELERFKEINLEKRLENLQFELQTLYLKNDSGKRSLLNQEIKEISDLVHLGKFLKCWRAYEKLKKIRNYQDYSDLNNNALILLEKFPEICDNFDYIIVDEFQDTNKVQLDFLKCLARKKNIIVVGDMNQSIYRFRGAYNKNFDEFKKYFDVGNSDVFNLDKSFRSSDRILRTAHKLICNNYSEEKECFQVKSFDNREGRQVEVYELKNAKEEARKVVEIINEELNRGVEPEEICVLYRNHNYGRIIKQALEFKGIEYCAVSKASLLKQKSVKTVVDYLTILNNLKFRKRGGEEAWWDLVYQQSFSEEDLIKVGKFLKDNCESENISAVLLNELEKIGLSDGGRVCAKMLIERIKLMIPSLSKNLSELVKDVFNYSGLAGRIESKEQKESMMNLNKFYELAVKHFSLHDADLEIFLAHLGILKNLGIEIEAARIEDKGIRLMTLHATKGLEYKIVIATNMAEKRFPMDRVQNNFLIPLCLSPEFINLGLSKNDMDYYLYEYERKHLLFEERRLCYVAFTRAKSRLVLTYASDYNGKRAFASKFLNEINYQSNSDIDFKLDSEEKYFTPEIKIKPAVSFDVLSRANFEGIVLNQNKVERKDVFSPSSLLTFNDCQKRFEYKYVYNMPEDKTIYWEAMRLGSFVHSVLEIGVKDKFSSVKEFIDFAHELNRMKGWENIELEEAEHLIKVFFERNKEKYSENSVTEQKLKLEIDGIKFIGYADRIDFNDDGIEIIDYKTGKGIVGVRERNWQLGYYALAASELGKVRWITLEMLRHEKPLEFELCDDGNAVEMSSGRMSFNIYEIKEELVSTAQKVLEAYDSGFKACSVEKNCEFCNEWVHGL